MDAVNNHAKFNSDEDWNIIRDSAGKLQKALREKLISIRDN